MKKTGTRKEVFEGQASMTGGGLKKKDLKYNKCGKLVSKKMSKLATLRYGGMFSNINNRTYKLEGVGAKTIILGRTILNNKLEQLKMYKNSKDITKSRGAFFRTGTNRTKPLREYIGQRYIILKDLLNNHNIQLSMPREYLINYEVTYLIRFVADMINNKSLTNNKISQKLTIFNNLILRLESIITLNIDEDKLIQLIKELTKNNITINDADQLITTIERTVMNTRLKSKQNNIVYKSVSNKLESGKINLQNATSILNADNRARNQRYHSL
jgi:sulfur relay (sulfurtransferase) DsrC/TusE family protein